MFFREAVRYDANPKDFIVKVFGGGNMFPGMGKKITCNPDSPRDEIHACTNVSCKNTAIVHSLAATYGFSVETHDTGGTGHRQVIFDIGSGHVWVRHSKLHESHQ